MKMENPVNLTLVDMFKNQKWLAQKIHVTQQHLNAVIHGGKESPVVKRKVSIILNRPISELWPDEE